MFKKLFIALGVSLAFSVCAQNTDFHPVTTEGGYNWANKQADAIAYMYDWYPYRWSTNQLLDVDTSGGTIAVNDALATVVSVTTPRTARPVQVEGVTVYGGDRYSINAVFNLLFCRAPLTWPDTNAAANLVGTELATNLATTISSTEGTWNTVGATNCMWVFTNRSEKFVTPMTNTIFIYAVNGGVITNTNSMRINLLLKQ